jgi:hypothetical protein
MLRSATWRSTWTGRIDGRGKWKGQWSVTETAQRIAPVAVLKEVIDTWNQVIDLVEKQFVAPMRDKAEKWNIQTRRSLSSLRRSMPAVEEME